MKRICILSTMFLLVACAFTWFGYHLRNPVDVPKPKSEPKPEPTVTLFEELIKSIYIPHFKAIEMPMNDALAQIEREINKASDLHSLDLRARITNSNFTEKKVTIVVKDTSLKTLFNLIGEQTNFQYRIESANNEIIFFSDTDVIIYGDDETINGPEIIPEILPPPP